jgi:transcription elongation factor Elf1
MEICPVCGGGVVGMWEQGLKVAVLVCRGCGKKYPVEVNQANNQSGENERGKDR